MRIAAELPFPAFIEGRYLDVLVANPLAAAIPPRLKAGGNRLRDVFLGPAEQALFLDWRGAAAGLLAGLRRSAGGGTDDPRVVELVGELTLAGPEFRRLWARHDIGPRAGATVTFHHPQVGTLRLDREKLAVSGTEGAMLVVYHPAPQTDSDTSASIRSEKSSARACTRRRRRSFRLLFRKMPTVGDFLYCPGLIRPRSRKS